ncbi:hypothetical protein PCIT_a2491 [Pseudoalteromonas citrea]|uniref:Solute-binding protein family 3/N-terminal domain-containing protein n=2 Tax=Pseudoalteromonas citrea TaxID=43655 RepID=A0AAD4AJX3_9GAMM|nr:hypothetical protein [Pseudoalteromonas citrea]KAF7772426.1 hypothetical protein PCIT_a2491 [Pseudoalteromonas citrea]
MRLVFAILFILVLPTSIAKPYTINASEALSYHLGQQQVVAIMSEIYRPLGITPHVVFMPSYRGLKHVEAGILDAEGGRVDIVMQKYSNIIKIPTAIANSQLAIFCLTKTACILNKTVSIIRIHGSLIAEYYCQHNSLKCTAVQNDVSAFQALGKSNAHILLANKIFPKGALCASGLKKIYLRLLKNEHYPVYHYVHQRNKHLVNQLNHSIKSLHSSGKLDALLEVLQGSFVKCGGQVIKLPDTELK